MSFRGRRCGECAWAEWHDEDGARYSESHCKHRPDLVADTSLACPAFEAASGVNFGEYMDVISQQYQNCCGKDTSDFVKHCVICAMRDNLPLRDALELWHKGDCKC
jgi:hypothetical protein